MLGRSSDVPLRQRIPRASWAVLGKASPAAQQYDPSLLLWGLRHIWSALSGIPAPQYETHMDILQQFQQMTMKIIKGWECLSYEMRLRELVLFSLEKGRLSRDLIDVYDHILKYRKFSFKHNYFTLRLVKHLEQVTQVLESLSLKKMNKACLDVDLSNFP